MDKVYIEISRVYRLEVEARGKDQLLGEEKSGVDFRYVFAYTFEVELMP